MTVFSGHVRVPGSVIVGLEMDVVRRLDAVRLLNDQLNDSDRELVDASVTVSAKDDVVVLSCGELETE